MNFEDEGVPLDRCRRRRPNDSDVFVLLINVMIWENDQIKYNKYSYYFDLNNNLDAL